MPAWVIYEGIAMSTQSSGQDSVFEKQLIAAMPWLDGLAMNLCRNRSQADDLKQETLVSAWKARASFTPGTSLKAWTCTIMLNRFRSDKRSAWCRRQMPWNELLAEQLMKIDDEQSPAVELHDALRMMEKLPASHRHALMMIGADGLSYDEASRIEHCPSGTLKSRVTRARRALKNMIENGTGSTGRIPSIPTVAIAA
jgi:RNA polymerase sigma-70 factor, ECF subfamily